MTSTHTGHLPRGILEAKRSEGCGFPGSGEISLLSADEPKQHGPHGRPRGEGQPGARCQGKKTRSQEAKPPGSVPLDLQNPALDCDSAVRRTPSPA